MCFPAKLPSVHLRSITIHRKGEKGSGKKKIKGFQAGCTMQPECTMIWVHQMDSPQKSTVHDSVYLSMNMSTRTWTQTVVILYSNLSYT